MSLGPKGASHLTCLATDYVSRGRALESGAAADASGQASKLDVMNFCIMQKGREGAHEQNAGADHGGGRKEEKSCRRSPMQDNSITEAQR